jgi:hypothetical protein
MIKIHIYYDAITGEIDGIDNGSFPIDRAGKKTLLLQVDKIPDRRTDKIDINSLFIVPKTATEIKEFDRPTKFDVDAAVYDALKTSDAFVLPDYPITQQQRDAWIIYRQKLRDISKGNPRPNAAQMIEAWPLDDPNGTDAVAHLRNRK